MQSCHFRGHTPGWLLLPFGQFTFCASEMTHLMQGRVTFAQAIEP